MPPTQKISFRTVATASEVCESAVCLQRSFATKMSGWVSCWNYWP